MKLHFHPEFPNDIRRFEADYQKISSGLKQRFRSEVDDALAAIKASPQSAGHFLQVNSKFVSEFRRRNLRAFPFFVLYGVTSEMVIVGSLVPSRSDPLTWLARFR